jgi:phosphopantetheinyl transferase
MVKYLCAKLAKLNRNCELKHMPPLFQHQPGPHTKIVVWQILETEEWFRERLPMDFSMKHPARLLQHMAGRYLLSWLDPNFPYDDIRISTHGRPYLEKGNRWFSISHSGDMATVILSGDSPVGVDLEFVAERVLKVVPRFLGKAELEWLDSIPGMRDAPSGKLGGPAALRLCTLLWSAKESAYKWLGETGLDFAKALEVDPFVPGEEGFMDARCRKDVETPFRIGYRFFPGFCLTWICDPLDKFVTPYR